MMFRWPSPSDRYEIARLFLGPTANEISYDAILQLTEIPLERVFATYNLLRKHHAHDLEVLNNELASAHKQMFALIEMNNQLIKELDEAAGVDGGWGLPSRTGGGSTVAGSIRDGGGRIPMQTRLSSEDVIEGDDEQEKRPQFEEQSFIKRQPPPGPLPSEDEISSEEDTEQEQYQQKHEKHWNPIQKPQMLQPSHPVQTLAVAQVKKDNGLTDWQRELQSVKAPTATLDDDVGHSRGRKFAATRRAKTVTCDCTTFCKNSSGCQCSLWKEPCGPKCHATARKTGIKLGQVPPDLNCPRQPNQTVRLRNWESGGFF